MSATKDIQVDPQWVRIPTACQVVEISRSLLEQYISNAAVKSRLLRKPGNVQGIRLVYLPSLLELVEKAEDGTRGKSPRPRKTK